MIQLNLLPDVKMEYIKAQRERRLVFSIAAIVTVACVVLLGFLLSYSGLQKKHLNDLSNDIASESKELKGKPEISKILTVQNQLSSLTALHAAKPAAGNVFGYLNDITPVQVSISHFTIDFTQQTISIEGAADSLSDVNKYIDTLKYTDYTVDSKDSGRAFGSVVLNSFSVGEGAEQQGGKKVSYTIGLTYQPAIFDNSQKVRLSVPSLMTTRAAVDNAPDLFQAPSSSSGGSQ